MRTTVLVLISALGLLTLLTPGRQQAFAQSNEDPEPIRVVTKRIEPFVFIVDDEISGFSIDLWEALAREADLEFEYVIVSTVQEQLEALTNNEADVAMAAISITEEREEIIDFSHSYLDSGLGILTNLKSEHTLRDAIRAATSPTILHIVAGLLIAIVIAGHAVWLVERRENPDFTQSYLKGVWEGIWWSTATVTTVGYGDKTPKHKLGRLFAIFWMLVGIFLIANFTASVTSELTYQRIQGTINGPDDLRGRHVVAVKGTTGDQWLTKQQIAHSTVASINDAFDLLDNKGAQAVVYDFPVLLFEVLQNPDKGYTVPAETFNPEDYGIAFPEGSPLREEVNRALLRLIEDGTYDEIYTKWYGIIFN